MQMVGKQDLKTMTGISPAKLFSNANTSVFSISLRNNMCVAYIYPTLDVF